MAENHYLLGGECPLLLSFRFANHRSFRDEQQLNLTPVYDAADGDTPGRPAVTVVGILGANASGKSNALNALTYMREFTLRSDREVEPGLGISRTPFKLSAQIAAEPARYVVDLLLDGIRHTYGFTIDGHRVVEEWLFQYPHNRRRKVFERDSDGFTWGEESAKRKELSRVAEITAPTALLLSTLARFNLGSESAPETPEHAVYLWFRRMLVDTGGRQVRGDGNIVWAENSHTRNIVVSLLRAADVGITDIEITNPGQQELFARRQEILTLHKDTYDRLNQLENSLVQPQSAKKLEREAIYKELALLQDRLASVNLLTQQLISTPPPVPRLQFIHCGAVGSATFELTDESTGTQRLLSLASDVMRVLANGGLLSVDEIDASLHPMLTAKLIGLFQSESTNSTNAQLIFTSHDATLLGTFDAEEVLQRDQIWFTEKDGEGASTLFPLSEFKPRKEGENRQRRYLNGNYGAIPDLSSDLFAQALSARGALDGDQTR